MRLIRPVELSTDEPLLWSSGTGATVWAMFCACSTGDLETVTRLLDADPALVRCHYEYRTPLSFAVRENQVDVAALLIERLTAPLIDIEADELLQIARDRGYVEMARLLERAPRVTRSTRAEVKARLERGGPDCDIWTAAHLGDVDRVRALLDQEPSLINRPADHLHHIGTPLIRAAATGHLDVATLLLERGADPNQREEGNAPHGRALYAAVYNGHLDVARLLLEHGAYPNPEVESSADALSIAIMNSDTAMIDLLVQHGATWSIPVQLAPEAEPEPEPKPETTPEAN